MQHPELCCNCKFYVIYSMFHIKPSFNVCYHLFVLYSIPEQCEVTKARVIGEYIIQLLCEFYCILPAGRLAPQHAPLISHAYHMRVHRDYQTCGGYALPAAYVNGRILAYHPAEEHVETLVCTDGITCKQPAHRINGQTNHIHHQHGRYLRFHSRPAFICVMKEGELHAHVGIACKPVEAIPCDFEIIAPFTPHHIIVGMTAKQGVHTLRSLQYLRSVPV